MMHNDILYKTKTVSAYKLFNEIQKEQLNYIYRGNFTADITKNILALTEKNMVKKNDPRELRRKVYNVMVEGLQNITRHQTNIDLEHNYSYGLLTLKHEPSKYFVTTGNLICNDEIDSLTNKIKKVNSLNKEQLKAYHLQVLKNGKLSKKGGAGLGLIDIARRSGSKLLYAFSTINSLFSYFYLHSEISTDLEGQNNGSNKNSLLNYNILHPMLNNENVLIAFTNYFNQDSLLEMLSFIEMQLAQSSKTKRQILNIMVEMFQNITKHAAGYKVSSKGKSGIFYISSNNGDFYITSGNYVPNNNVDHLKNRLNYINNQDLEELEEFYSQRLFDFEIDSSESAGLGLIDLCLKSGNKLEYGFEKVNEDYSFYTLKVRISNE